MTDFNIIKSTSKDLFWYELFQYAELYANLGTYFIKKLSAVARSAPQLEKVMVTSLENVIAETQNLKNAAAQTLNNMSVKERTAEVLGIKESIDYYPSIKDLSIIGGAIAASAQIKGKLDFLLNDSQTPVEYYHLYNALRLTLLPMRAVCFTLFDRPIDEIKTLVKGELTDLLLNKTRAIEVAREIGSNRVSSIFQKVTRFSEPPVEEIEAVFWIMVDGTTAYSDTFSAITPAIRRAVKQERVNLVNKAAEGAAKAIVECYQEADNLIPLL